MAAGIDGHVLVFLPGAAEIRRAMTACAAARAPPRSDAGARCTATSRRRSRIARCSPSAQRKVILSTNVAESSVTIEGVTAVIDSGLARIAGHSPWSGLPTLKVARISQASANQRAGRAGRTAPGRAIRLYPLEDFVRRPAHDAPEIVRADLAPAALQLRAMRIAGFGALDWLDQPPAAHVDAADDLLRSLHAIDAAGDLTAEGRAMARYPLHPRLSRLVLEAVRRGVGEDGCRFAAQLTLRTTARAVRQILRIVQSAAAAAAHDEQALDIRDPRPRSRTGWRAAARANELQLSGGGSALLAPDCQIHGDFMVAVEIEDRRIRSCRSCVRPAPIEPAWLLDLFPERVRGEGGAAMEPRRRARGEPRARCSTTA